MKRLTLDELDQIKSILVRAQHFELAARVREQVPKKIRNKQHKERVKESWVENIPGFGPVYFTNTYEPGLAEAIKKEFTELNQPPKK